MYFVYILYSQNFDRYYVGQTNNLEKRLKKHNKGYVKSTKALVPWTLKYSESFETRKQAMNRETQIKKMKSRKYIVDLINASRKSGL